MGRYSTELHYLGVLVWLCVLTQGTGGGCPGGIFSMRMLFPANYPDGPPKLRFTCEMFHPNGV